MFKLLILLATFLAIYVNAHASTVHQQRDLKTGETVFYHLTLHEVVVKKMKQATW